MLSKGKDSPGIPLSLGAGKYWGVSFQLCAWILQEIEMDLCILQGAEISSCQTPRVQPTAGVAVPAAQLALVILGQPDLPVAELSAPFSPLITPTLGWDRW